MRCHQARLNALADGELGAWAAARVQRHLQACPSCAAEYAELLALGDQARAWRHVTAPAGLETRIAAALRTQGGPLRVFVWRPFAAVAATAAAVAAITLLIPGQPGRPAPAFADVERAMGAVQSVSWEWDDTWQQGRTSHLSRRWAWVRRSPPATADYEADLDEWSLSDARGYVGYSRKHNTYIKRPLEKYGQKDAQNLIRRFTEPFAAASDITPAVNAHWTPWRRERVMLEGRPCWEFSREERQNPAQASPQAGRLAPPSRGLYRMRLWADTGTLRVARIEFARSGSDSGGPPRTVFSNFQYNRTPPKGVFDWSPPLGAKEFKPSP